MSKNSNSGMTGGQKCFLGVVGLLVIDAIITNLFRLKNNKNVLKSYYGDKNKDSEDDNE